MKGSFIQNVSNDERIIWVDLVKGYAMLCVMLHHVTFTPMVYRTFYVPFFLTAFFVVSGYTFSSKRPFVQFLCRKIKALLVPLFSLGIICILMSQILSFNEREGFVQQVIELLLQDGTGGHRLWFVAAMFIACCIFYPISKLNGKQFVWVCLALAIFNIIFRKYICSAYLPWHLSVVGMACFWMGIGYYAKRFVCPNNLMKAIESKRVLLVVVLVYGVFLCISCSLLKADYVGFSDFTELPIIYFVLNGLGTLLLVCLGNQRHFIWLSKFLTFIGQNTLFYFAFHGKVQSVLMAIFMKMDVLSFFESYNYISVLIFVILEAVILILPSIACKKWLPFLVGK